jgi:succinoglycan biosynthesis protein ExoO
MSIKPEVSIVIPAYNTAAYIGRAIESALGQTLTNIEIILVDDASTDRTLAIASSFVDSRLKVFSNPENLGVSATRNWAISQAQGHWIAVLDSDDWYAPTRLERLVHIASQQQADLIADDLYLVKDGEDRAWSTLITESGESIVAIKQIDPVYFVETDVYGELGLRLGISKPLFRREFLLQHQIRYDSGIKVGEDFWLTLTCLARGGKFLLVPEPYYYYVVRSNSLVYNNSKLVYLNQNCASTLNFIKTEQIVKSSPQLERALMEKYQTLHRYLDYFTFLDLLQHRKWQAVTDLLSKPYISIYIAKRIPGIIHRRIQYYLFGNKTVYDIFHRKSVPQQHNFYYSLKKALSKLS